MSFDYLIDKIAAAPITSAPFNHIQINGFFSDTHFSQITTTPEIALPAAKSDEHLFEQLFNSGWKIISFPGCITDHRTYLEWHKHKNTNQTLNNSACEGFGVTLRLVAPKSAMLEDLSAFMATEKFHIALAERFNIAIDKVFYDGGVQKYLDGYEISPHPDDRRKALTYMVNVNPGRISETQDHHTHYLKFKNAYKYVEIYWDGHPNEQRCWVPWDWCDSSKVQTENNSIVIFSPNNQTMHGVKAKYDHLPYQRTQLYGNLWYHENPTLPTPSWEDFVITPGAYKAAHRPVSSLQSTLRAMVPNPVRACIRKVLRRDAQSVVADRKLGGY